MSESTYCGCETARHFDGGPGHPYGQPNGPTLRLNVPWLAGEPFCQECRRDCWPDYADAVTTSAE